MKPTIRVSIGGLAFNLEEDAYRVLDDYLRALRGHFENNPESGEIISDIEFRLSELLQMRVNSADGVVLMPDALDIIKIMGNPKDFDDAEPAFEATGRINDRIQDNFKKKLHRDVDNKLLGGVCSGLGHYFRIDATIVRLIFAGLFLLLLFFVNKGPSCMGVVLIYGVLWAVMPAAHSFTQKLSMTGSDPSILNIGEERVQPSSRKYKGSSFVSAIGIILNIFIGFLAVILLIVILAIVASFVWLYFDTTIFGLNNYLVLLGLDSVNLKIAFILSALLPLIGLFWLMVKVLKRSQFTGQTLIWFVVGFILWLGASFYIGNVGYEYGIKHRHKAESVETVNANTASDSLYVKLSNEYLTAENQPNNPFILYKGASLDNRELCVLPSIKVREDTTLTGYVIEIHKKDFAENRIVAERKAGKIKLNYTLTDSLLIINPQWYTSSKPWNLEMVEIVIKTPREKKVIKEYPFNESYKYIRNRNINWGISFYTSRL